ncbi:phosphoglycerate kinase [Candidatus Jorgensenbacteria bacterium]|nr:phosphoglycerate kinase [Candidatus Jorgensenbacteria bacterium]
MIKYLSKLNLRKYSGKICLLRIDLNIEPGQEKSTIRIDAVLPTIRSLLRHKTKVVLLSHRGRPVLKPEKSLKGLKSDWTFNKTNRDLSLKLFARIFRQKLGLPLHFISYEHSWLTHPKEFIKSQKAKVFLLENLRFYRGEETNDSRFAQFLSKWGDFYVNDAFAVSHRKNASVAVITRYMPSYAGLLLEQEIKNLNRAMKGYHHPFTIIIGGAKIADKLDVLKYFWRKADCFLLGGGPANTFFAAQGLPTGDSTVDLKAVSTIKKFLEFSKIMLPADVKIFSHKRKHQILDIGANTIREWSTVIGRSKTIIWSGPVGRFKQKGFEKGTRAIWQGIAVAARRGATVIVGGGETTSSLSLLRGYKFVLPKNVFVSTGGGAMLEYLSGKNMPGIEALTK